MSVTQISATALQEKLNNDDDLFLLDVREPYEFDLASISGSQLIPMNQLPQRLHELDKQSACVVICHHGIRSQYVADFLDHSGFDNIYNLTGGIHAWSVECDANIPQY